MRTLSRESTIKLVDFLAMLGLSKEMVLDIITAIETPEELTLFCDKLLEQPDLSKLTPEEVYEMAGDTINELNW